MSQCFDLKIFLEAFFLSFLEYFSEALVLFTKQLTWVKYGCSSIIRVQL